MNNVCIIGRLVRDPDVRYTSGGEPMAVARFTVAVNRPRSKDKEQTSDFPSFVAFGKTAELLEKYFKKGNLIGVTGRIQTGSYTDKNGAKVYTTDVVAEKVHFLESRKDKKDEPKENPGYDGFEQLEENIPF